MKAPVIFIVLLMMAHQVFSQKSMHALRIDKPVKVDGILDEEAWDIADKASEFVQRSPEPGKEPTQKTRVSIMYNDAYIYVGAWMYDTEPAGIMTELNSRDQGGNVDQFTVYFDTYKDGLNAFIFSVTAAGVQMDAKMSPGNYDQNWDAGWYSDVKITEEGWFAELEIPLSALRFPASETQEWGMNIRREIQRNNESVYWSEVNPKISGFVNQFGVLTGLEGIKTPLRLSILPYFSAYVNRHYDPDLNSSSTSTNFRGGMDIKYGINDAFTMDMMLVPDFGQVLSDNNVLNLGPYEVYNSERRQFFIESTELFEKGGIFYSRRIGGSPVGHDSVEEQLQEGEEIYDNPLESRIINATKITGRAKNGLGVGFLNTLTNKSYATIINPDGEKRLYEVSPIVNYNVFVLDKSLKNNSYISLTNTNVTRSENYYDANVTATNFRLADKTNTYALGGNAVLSDQYGFTSEDDNVGYRTNMWLGKTSGNILYRLGNSIESDKYNPNDLGFNRSPNSNHSYMNVEYREYDPFYKFLDFSAELQANYYRRYVPNVFTGLSLESSVRATFTNYLSTRIWFDFAPLERKDFDDTRVDGRFIIEPKYNSTGLSFYTDSRKKFRLSTWMQYSQTSQDNRNSYSLSLSPRLRINNQLSVSTSFSGYGSNHSIGYVSDSEDVINFGDRNVRSFTNIITTKFTFNKDMDIYFRMRHYWSSAKYNAYYELGQDGNLIDTDYSENNDVNFNSFNIDMVYKWIFSPASEFSVVWKSAALNSTDQPVYDYTQNFLNTFDASRDNSISFKVLYYLDYMMIMRSRS